MAYLTPTWPQSFVPVSLQVPDTLLPHVNGAIASLWEPWRWEAFGGMTVDETMQWVGSIVVSIQEAPLEVGYPKQVPLIMLYPSAYGAGINRQINSLVYGGAAIYTSGEQGNYIEYQALLGIGHWKLEWMTVEASSGGIIKVLLDGTELQSYDAYKSPTQNNVFHSVPDFLISTPKSYAIRFQSTTKNASSSAYFIHLISGTLTRLP